MTLSAARDSLKTALETISGLTVYDTAPESLSRLPCLYILPRSGSYLEDFGDDVHHRLELVLLVAKAKGLGRSQDALDAYLEPTGASSIRAKVTSVSGAVCEGYRDYGGMQYGEGDEIYLGCKFDVSIYA